MLIENFENKPSYGLWWKVVRHWLQNSLQCITCSRYGTSQDLKLWQKNHCLLVTWVPRHGGRQYLRLLLTSRSLLLRPRHGGWPSREGWEGEKAKGGESHRVGKVQSSTISVHVFQFIYNIHTSHLSISTSSAWYTYISGTGGSSRFPSGLVSSSTGTGSSVQARWFCHKPD